MANLPMHSAHATATNSSSPVSSFSEPTVIDEKTSAPATKLNSKEAEMKAEVVSAEAAGGEGGWANEGNLQRQLKTRHIQMISIGGVIGTGK